MKKVCLVMMLLLVMSAAALAAKPFTIKLGVVTKPGAAQNIVAEKFKELVEARSDGAYTVKIYHSAAIGNETEILQQIQMGTIHMGVITGGPLYRCLPGAGGRAEADGSVPGAPGAEPADPDAGGDAIKGFFVYFQQVSLCLNRWVRGAVCAMMGSKGNIFICSSGIYCCLLS